MTSEQLLLALLAATPEPPGTDVDDLLAAFARMIDLRQELIDAPGAPLAPSPADHVLLEELARRDASWKHALAVAHQQLGAQRVAATKVRAYGQL
ncbi:MAG: hypothetical protein WKG01_28580 [Kofleriaceae bacterium]